MTVTGSSTIELPLDDGRLETYKVSEPRHYVPPAAPLQSRVFFAAAHVVADPLREPDGTGVARLDWESTLAFRRHLWRWGLGVAEAMDTAQRGMGLDWPTARELIRLSTQEARAVGGRIVCGAGTDQLDARRWSLDAIAAAYLEQATLVEASGAQVVLLASRALAAAAAGADDYLEVYGRVLDSLDRPVVLHWLGEAFDPLLAGYWGTSDLPTAMATVLALVAEHAARIDGIKVSLLDAAYEIELRNALPTGIRLYTGDDFNYPQLIRGDGRRSSDALLGIFDPIAPAASAALQALDAGDEQRFDEILDPTVPLARHLFAAPTQFYKTGIVFLAYLNGHQSHFRMVGGLEGARSIEHLARLFVLADRAGTLDDPEHAVERMRRVLLAAGVTR